MKTGPAGKWGIWLAIGALTLLLMACADTGYTQPGAGLAAPVVTSADLQPTIDAAQVERYLGAIEAEETLRRYNAEATATAEARAALAWEATLTAEARQAEATATTWQTTVEAAQAQATATALALNLAGTATAEAQATSARMTLEAWNVTLTAVADVQAAEAAIRDEQIAREQLATQRERIIYPIKAYGPWVLMTIAVGVMLWGLIGLVQAQLRMQAIHRDARGDAPLIVIRQGGKMVVYDGDRSFGPAVTVDALGNVAQPALTGPEEQQGVTARDQAIDMAHRGLPEQRHPANPGKAAELAAPPIYRVLPVGQRPPAQVVDAQVMNALEDDWREE